MSTVYVIGAGASYGEQLEQLEHIPEDQVMFRNAPPPLADGFFRRALFDQIAYSPEDAEKDFPDAFKWIRAEHLNSGEEPLGEGAWAELNIEDVFTGIELRREFEPPEGTAGAILGVIRNQLLAYIYRIIGACTHNSYGRYSRRLSEFLGNEDSIITFNWDLLLDEALAGVGKGHVGAFMNTRKNELDPFVFPDGPGMLLKLHGSLNWFRCTNPRCENVREILYYGGVKNCLERAMGIHWGGESCVRCGSATTPILVPPLLRKPVTEDSVIRSVWGLARNHLLAANKVVVIGFSAAPTDFYAAWLLRSTLNRKDVQVAVVNPSNAKDAADHHHFAYRMGKIFPFGYNVDFCTFADIDKCSELFVRRD